jgi:NAD(P)-dependent dehydrogenase (short-subunit alcohol dehydrogenase family)
MFSLDNKAAFIAGASGDIGYAVAKRFSEAGARVVITDITDGRAEAAAISASFIELDVSNEQQVAEVLAAAAAEIGELDIVVNNAGVGDVGATVEQTEQSTLEKLTRINQWGVLYGLKHAPVQTNDHGSIINTSSLAGLLKVPGTGGIRRRQGRGHQHDAYVGARAGGTRYPRKRCLPRLRGHRHGQRG